MKRFYGVLWAVFCLVNYSFAQNTVGLQLHNKGSLDSGYVLFAPIANNTTYLIDKCGKEVHSWLSNYSPGLSVYLQPDGSLLRTGMLPVGDNPVFMNGAGAGGIIEKIDWDGNVTWSYRICDSLQCQHHDIEPLPNGNILAIVWDQKNLDECRAVGFNANIGPNPLWSEKIVELKPTGTNGATIVWQWSVWDHMVQNFDKSARNFDSIKGHPELIDINYAQSPNSDWLHINSVKYNPDLDQIVLSVHNWSEIWIIDHSTTTAQAASHFGGKSGKGGDLLYRWGNPATYHEGTTADQKLFSQHDVSWIPKGLPNAGKLLLFNNGLSRPAGAYSSVEMLTPATNAFGGGYNTKTRPYLPVTTGWVYTAPVKTSFYSAFISGAQMLTNGNILVCNGGAGDFFEINTSKTKVWDYVNPINNLGPVSQGTPSGFSVFRCTFYPYSYPAFKGRSLKAGKPLEINPSSYTCSPDTAYDSNHTSGIATIDPAKNFNVVSPFSGGIKIQPNINAQKVSISLYDMAGRQVSAWSSLNVNEGQPMYLDPVEKLNSGIYFIKISNSYIDITRKIVKE